MSVRGACQLTHPDAVECSLTLTMTLAEWKRVRADLSVQYPSWAVAALITGLIEDAEKQFYREKELAP